VETISSGQTFFIKRIFPVVWLGFVLLVSSSVIGAMIHHQKSINPAFFVWMLLMSVIPFVFFRKLLWNLADEVRDGGTFLVVRKGSVEDRVQLANVVNVNMSQFTNPKRLTLRLRTPGKFGDEIAFVPKSPVFQFNAFARNAIAESLIQRVDRALQQG
jgi:hypothetical protein